jgi:hypothetical protein
VSVIVRERGIVDKAVEARRETGATRGGSEVIGKSCVEVGDVIIACDKVLGSTRAKRATTGGRSEVIGKSCVEVGDVIIACDEVLGLTRAKQTYQFIFLWCAKKERTLQCGCTPNNGRSVRGKW